MEPIICVHTEKYNIIQELGICGCGIPKDTYKAVHEMLRGVASKTVAQLLNEDPYKYFMVYTLDQLCFIDHGIDIRCSWLTEKGIKLLDAMDIFEKYNYDWQYVYDVMPNEFYVEE